MVALRYGHSRPDMRAYPLPTAVRLDAGELIEASLKPFVESVGDLQSLMLGVMRGQHAIGGSLGSFRGEIAVQLKNRDAFRHQLGGVNLHFVIALSVQACSPTGQENGGCDVVAHNSFLVWRVEMNAPSYCNPIQGAFRFKGILPMRQPLPPVVDARRLTEDWLPHEGHAGGASRRSSGGTGSQVGNGAAARQIRHRQPLDVQEFAWLLLPSHRLPE